MGSPVWLDLKDPDNLELQRLVVAQDVGGAITGPVRGGLLEQLGGHSMVSQIELDEGPQPPGPFPRFQSRPVVDQRAARF